MIAPDNPPAFHPQLGVTVRDYFAAKAMAALMVHVSNKAEVAVLAKTAYVWADHMLYERAKRKEGGA